MNALNAGLERRKEPRSLSDLSVNIRILPAGPTFAGRILDFASGGLGVACPQPLEAGAAVIVTYKGVLMLSEVVHCTHSGSGYRVGMAVDQALATSHLSVRDAENEIRELTATYIADTGTVPMSVRPLAAAV